MERRPDDGIEIKSSPFANSKDHSLLDRKVVDNDKMSFERTFECKEIPPWQNQLTLRAFVVSFLLGILFTFIVMKINLTTGIIPSLNVSAGLLGFFFVKSWTKLLEKSGMLRQPFTRQENTIIQTCVVAISGIAFSGGVESYILGMSLFEVKQSAEANAAQNVKNPELGWMIGFLFVVLFLGLFSIVPLHKVLKNWNIKVEIGYTSYSTKMRKKT
uniref:Uncharacterized protein n=1 Tax=Nelumbo nucifera TaxID=4432 RepID=A0A822YIU2_NELNU|nr:TPA_asm: hypothetical protein HUJ06_011263 [Nelumbo nucifera]